MTSPDETITGLFSKLNAQIKSGQLKKALRTAEEALKISPGDRDASKAKAYLLIDLDKCQEALAFIEKAPRDIAPSLQYEKAYCLYRLEKLTQSLEALRGVEGDRQVAKLQLQAQLHHRLNRSENAIQDYQALFTQHKVTGLNTRTNIVAAYVAGGKAGEVPAVTEALKISGNDGFEVAFNLACSQLQAGDPAKARDLLTLATRLGRESLLDEDYTEEETERELAPVSLQLAYATALAGENQQALQEYEELGSISLSDEGSKAIAVNNQLAQKLVCAAPEQQRGIILDSLKQLDSLFEKGMVGLQLKSSVEGRLSTAQQHAVYANRVLLLLSAGRLQSAKDITQRLLRKFPDAAGIQALRAVIAAQEGKAKEALAAVEALPNSHGSHLTLLRAQLAAQAQNYGQAAELLSRLGQEGLSQRPAVIASQSALLEASGKQEEALALAARAYDAIQGSKSKSKAEKADASRSVLPILARLQLKAGKVSEAFKTFQQLQSVDSDVAGSAVVVGQLAAASLSQDPEAATSLEKYLETLPGMSPETLDGLEATGTGRMSKLETGSKAARAEAGDGGVKKRKRKRQTRLPQGFDPENPGSPPDPERWLPKWQRAEFKRKRRSRKDKEKGKGHQGGAVDESLDRTHTETPAVAPNLPKRGQRPRGKAGRR